MKIFAIYYKSLSSRFIKSSLSRSNLTRQSLVRNSSNKRRFSDEWASFFSHREFSRGVSRLRSKAIGSITDGDEKLGAKGLEEIRKIVAILCNNIYKVGEFGLKPSEATIEFACPLPQTFLSARQWIIQILIQIRFITLFSNERESFERGQNDS